MTIYVISHLVPGNLRLNFAGSDTVIVVNEVVFSAQSEVCKVLASKAVNGTLDMLGPVGMAQFDKSYLLLYYFHWMHHIDNNLNWPGNFEDWVGLLAFDDYMGTTIVAGRLVEGVSKMMRWLREFSSGPIIEESDRMHTATIIRGLLERRAITDADSLWAVLYRSEDKPARVLDYIENIMRDSPSDQRRAFIDAVLSLAPGKVDVTFDEYDI